MTLDDGSIQKGDREGGQLEGYGKHFLDICCTFVCYLLNMLWDDFGMILG
jgi:hypothetical protein